MEDNGSLSVEEIASKCKIETTIETTEKKDLTQEGSQWAEMPLFDQGDYGDIPYGKRSISCGPTTLSSAFSLTAQVLKSITSAVSVPSQSS